jgi:hypothetical protein
MPLPESLSAYTKASPSIRYLPFPADGEPGVGFLGASIFRIAIPR